MRMVDLVVGLGAAFLISAWFVLTYRWMHAFDDAGEHWWAVYVPIYRTVAALRTVGASGHWAWLIIAWYVGLLTMRTPTPETNGTFGLLLLLPTVLLQALLWDKQRRLIG